MALSFDIARCGVTHENYHCPLAHHCLRRIDKGRPEYQAFTAFKGGPDCDGFIDDAQRTTEPPEA